MDSSNTSRKTAKGLRRRLMLVLAMSVVVVGLLPGPVQAGWLTDTWPGSTAAPGSEADQVLELARKQVGKPYRFSAVGPDAFDCSGLIWFLFKSTGLADRMGGKRRGATAYLNWFKQYGEWSPNLADARPGDILVWGGGQHAGAARHRAPACDMPAVGPASRGRGLTAWARSASVSGRRRRAAARPR